MDGATGRVIYERNADAARYPASLTKVMTLYLLFEALEHGQVTLETRITASRHASNQEPTKLGVDRGDTIPYDVAIRAMVVRSANDVAVMVAEALGGTEDHFATMMTRKAQALGMSNTRFRNASGLPEAGQMTTARDLALLGRRIAYDFPQYYHYFAIPSFSYAGRTYNTHDNLLALFPGSDGLKTGYTRISGFNLLTSVVRGNQHVVGVVMGGRTAHERDQEMMWMLSQVYDKAANNQIALAHANVPWRSGSGPKTRPFSDRPAPTRTSPVVVAAAEPPPPAAQSPLAPIVVMQQLPRRPVPAAEDDRIAALIASIDDEDQAEVASREPPRRAPVPVANPRQAIQLARAPEAARSPAAAAPPPATRPTPKPQTQVASLSRASRASREPQIEEGDIGDSPPPRITPAVAIGAKPAAADGPRRWSVQIGAFVNQREAQMKLAIYAERSMDVVGQARRIVAPFNGSDGNKLYRARFGGFGESEAREVCRRMTQRGQTCFATAAD